MSIKTIDVLSNNFDERPAGCVIDTIVLHYTDLLDVNLSLKYLCDPQKKVSSHLLIDVNGEIYKLVDYEKRSWHAGISCWQEKTNINNNSIGIELQNYGESGFIQYGCWPQYPLEQINSLLKLIDYLTSIYPIKKDLIIGHNDIAPFRKKDPGPCFPWHSLREKGYGFVKNLISNINCAQKVQSILKIVGYDCPQSKIFDDPTNQIIEIYNQHFLR